MVVLRLMFAVSGVSAEWVGESFISLRVSLPGGSTYRITYKSVNESNATETKTVTTNSISHVIKDFRPDWFYTVLVEAVSLDSDEAVNGSIGIGEQYHAILFTCVEAFLYILSCAILLCKLCNCAFFVIWPAGIGIAVTLAVAVAVIFILLGLCCCWLARLVEQHFAHTCPYCTTTVYKHAYINAISVIASPPLLYTRPFTGTGNIGKGHSFISLDRWHGDQTGLQ